MAAPATSSWLPQCSSCLRSAARIRPGAWRPQQQQTRNKSKAAREAERNIVVQLRMDVPRFGRAGSYIPINPALMRNRWFPSRIADYVPVLALKQLKLQGVEMVRDANFGIKAILEEVDEDVKVAQAPKHYVRPIAVQLLSPERSLELINTFVPPTIDFTRQPIEQDEDEDTGRRYGASGAADILSAISASKPKPPANSIYGSVSTADVAATIKSALAHNDEAARVLLSESDVKFTNNPDDDTSRVKQLGTFKIEIQLPGADGPVRRNVRVRAKPSDA